MNINNASDSFVPLHDVLRYINLAAGMNISESSWSSLEPVSKWRSALDSVPLILGFIGFLFNIIALLVFTASKTFRQSSFRCFIYAFIVVNCGSILMHSGFYLLFYVVDPTYVCKYIQYLQQSLSTTSLWFMVVLSVERSITFAQPYIVKKFVKSRNIYLILFIVVVACFLLCLDDVISVDIKAFRWVNFAYGLCSVKRRMRLSTDRVKILFHIFSFILPFLINCLLDIYICYKICQRRRSLVKRSTSTCSNNNKRRRSKISLANEITLTLLCQSLWLLITYFPARLYYSLISFKLIDDHDRDNSNWTLFIRLNLLIYLAFSPTLYVILSPTLRRDIRSHLCHYTVGKRTTSSTFLSIAHRKLDKLLVDRRVPALHRSRRSLAIVTSRSEEIPRRMTLTVPVKLYGPEAVSRSAPCLPSFDEANEPTAKIERSSTVHDS